MSIKQLDRLLYVQGGNCYFCDVKLPKTKASVEHLDSRANGGSKADANCVACCTEINALLGSMTLKEKIRVIMNQKGQFRCPARTAAAAAPAVAKTSPPKPPAAAAATDKSPAAIPTPPTPAPTLDPYSRVLADLTRRGDSRPKRLDTLKSTVRAVVKSAKGELSDTQLEDLLNRLQATGKIRVDGTNVVYSLPPAKPASPEVSRP